MVVMRLLLGLLEEANLKTDVTLARLLETEAHVQAFDESIYRAKIRTELEESTEINWSRAAAFICLHFDVAAHAESATAAG